ncbi:hypothetical protein, partial [Listeria monocytogenes]|uniref:hypothetical protein n=1 Tax=Listeria monocytogenes TaxID=1639 RepID=UPI002FDC3319
INQAVKKYYDRKENTYEFKNDFENLSKDKKEIVNRIGKLEPVIQKLKNKDNKDAYRALEIIEKLDNKMKLSDYENSLLNKYS